MKYFPLYISLMDKTVLVYGGGKIATRRITTLLSFCKNIIVIAPSISDTLRTLVLQKKITWYEEDYTSTQITQITPDIILAATDSISVNHDIYIVGTSHHMLVNRCDCPEECSFFFPAIIEHDEITASITANGTNHTLVRTLATKIRELLDSSL